MPRPPALSDSVSSVRDEWNAGATPEARPIETLIWAAVLTAFCVFLFPYALNLPMQMWPNSWDLDTILKGLSSIR